MSLQSMTGFAQSDGEHGGFTWRWEVRSVNNRGLDVRLRLPPGWEALDPKVRDAVGKRFVRGSISLALNVTRDATASPVRVNEAVLAELTAVASRLQEKLGGEPPRAEALLALRGVLEVGEAPVDAAATPARDAAVLASLEVALDELAAARASEGKRLEAVLKAQAAEIGRLTSLVAASPSRQPDAIRRRLADNVARLVETNAGFDPERLHQEAVLLATRTDVEEELKRLSAHLEALRELIAAPGPAGRKLDFLAQEFNRESNTLTSKAGDPETGRLGLALKVVVDQMREQVQNIE